MSMDYEKAIEKARNIYLASEDKEILKTLEVIFPELKDGEKIRKELIRYVESWQKGCCLWNSDEDFCNDAIAWLEKQGKQKPSWSEEDERIRKEIIQSIKDNMCVIHKDKCLSWLEKQGWSVQDEAFLGDAIYAAKNTYSKNCGQEELIDWLKSFKPHNWKPSKDQMFALKMHIRENPNLESLYNDLLKL